MIGSLFYFFVCRKMERLKMEIDRALNSVMEEVNEYTKKQLYDYLKKNFPILESFNGANRQFLVEVLKG